MNRFTIYAGGPLLAALADTRDDEDGGNRSGRLATVCERYRGIISHELATLDLTFREWCAVLDALNGYWSDAYSLPYIAAEVAEAPELGEKWGIDQAALVGRIAALPLSGKAAIVEAAARFWARSEMETPLAMAAAGIRPSDGLGAGVDAARETPPD